MQIGMIGLGRMGDQVESAWSIITPILDAWDSIPAADLPNYQPGTRGPEATEVMIARDGHSWLQPTVKRDELVVETP